MKSRPFFYYVVAGVFLICGLSLPTQVIVNYQIPFAESLLAFHYLTNVNLFMMGVYFALAYSSFNSSRVVLGLLPIALLLTVYNNYLVGNWG
ncbi:MAG: hypothetical protein AAF202_13970, partial [Pseudomonadota bacterium]